MRRNTMNRRTVLTRCGVAAAGVAAGATVLTAQSTNGRATPAPHPQDAWLDAVPGRHRSFIDATTVRGAGEAVLYANNLYEANKTGYALTDSDVAIVICLRHFATAFAFTDAMWAKYGGPMSAMLDFTDPKTKQAPTKNLLNADGYGMSLPNLGNTLDAVRKRGTRFAICDMATRFVARQVAGSTGNADAIYKELVANRIPDSHMVPAGVVAVNRAQEHGFTLLTTL
ncbi:MAG: twin-arginine translocation signal domain-containing protein [Vicinamibacterales bacterium]